MTNLLKSSALLIAVLFSTSIAGQTYNDALAAMQFRDWGKAVDILNKITQSNPTDQDAWLSLYSAHMAGGNKDLAMKAMEGLSQNNGEGAKALIANGRVMMLRNNPMETDRQFDKAMRAGKKDASTFRFIGESYLFAPPDEKPNYVRAIDFLKKGYDTNSRDFQTLMSIGFAYKEQGRGGEAAQYYEFASIVEPKNPLPVYLLGRVYAIAKLQDKAINYYNKAIAVAPSYAPALRAKAEYYFFDLKNYEEATKAYKDLIIYSDFVTIEDEMQYANCLFIVRDYKGCIEQVEKVIKKDPSKTYLRRLLAYCYYETGEYAKGLEVLKNYFTIVEKEKELPSDYLYLANLQLKTGGDTLQAIGNLQKMISMDSSRWDYLKDIGDLYYKVKDYCNAAIAYQLRVDSLRDDTKSLDYYYLGLSYFYCKNGEPKFEQALTAFAKITEKSPTSTIGWFWAGRAASKLDPDVTTGDTALISQFGMARPFFEKYAELATAGSIEKEKTNLIAAYEYLVYYHFLKKEDGEALRLIDLLLVLDPTNETAIGIKDNILKSGSGKNRK